MPIHKRPNDKGNLLVKFQIIFPPNNFVDPAKITVCIVYIALFRISDTNAVFVVLFKFVSTEYILPS